MGRLVCSELWVMQDLCHQPYFAGFGASGRGSHAKEFEFEGAVCAHESGFRI